MEPYKNFAIGDFNVMSAPVDHPFQELLHSFLKMMMKQLYTLVTLDSMEDGLN